MCIHTQPKITAGRVVLNSLWLNLGRGHRVPSLSSLCHHSPAVMSCQTCKQYCLPLSNHWLPCFFVRNITAVVSSAGKYTVATMPEPKHAPRMERRNQILLWTCFSHCFKSVPLIKRRPVCWHRGENVDVVTTVPRLTLMLLSSKTCLNLATSSKGTGRSLRYALHSM